MQWSIVERPGVEKALRKAPKQIVKKYQQWLELVKYQGPVAIQRSSGYHDHALVGNWQGCRASRLSKKYRVIYSIQQYEITVFVEKVDSHTYR